MISKSEQKSLLGKEPYFDDIMCSLQSGPKMPKGIINEAKELLAYCRKFNNEVARPLALKIDLEHQKNPDTLSVELMNEANKWGFYTMFFPKAIGGHGKSFFAAGIAFEELVSCCAGIANVVGVHYLGVAALGVTGNVRLINKIFKDVVKGEKTGKPCTLSTAITEPEAGTDVEEISLVDKGKITCLAEKVKGGYVVNGRKIFISMGHMATWHMLIAYSNLKKPSENMVMLAVKTGTKGFSFGRQEKKMGQKACPASELIFEDCFIPDEFVCAEPSQFKGFKNSMAHIHEQLIDYVLGASRAGVGAFGTGVARGAYEEALKFASETEVGGKLLINHVWAQCMLAEMYKNVIAARLTYMDGNYINGLYSLIKAMQIKPVYYYLKYMPAFMLKAFSAPFMGVPFIADMITNVMRRRLYDSDYISEKEMQRIAGSGSVAKFYGTDMGVKNSHMALEMMGKAGLRHDRGVEKHLRDAKLFQIYEGTNQLNRLNVFKCLIGREISGVKVYDSK